jgi:hypothetical protein
MDTQLLWAISPLAAVGFILGIVGLYFASRERKANRARRAAINAHPTSPSSR